MDGAARAFGASTEIEIRGRKYEVRPRIIDMWAAIEQRILSLRPDPFAVAREKIAMFDGQPEIQKQLLQMAFDEVKQHRSVAGEEARAWCNTLDGVAFTLWLAIKHNPDPPTESDVKLWLLGMIDEMVNEIQKATESATAAEAMDRARDEVLEKVHAVMNQASGEDLRGNSTGLPTTTTTEAGKIQTGDTP